jgi:prolipoprotein diacylglyceryltransferase
VEILRAKDDRLLGVLTLAQAFSIVLILIGAYLIMAWGKETVAAGPWVMDSKTARKSAK